jgi:IstB-like ATP binding protein
VVTRRYDAGKPVLSTNKAFSEWGEVFPHAACVVTLVDRLIHHAEFIDIDADSYRLKEPKSSPPPAPPAAAAMLAFSNARRLFAEFHERMPSPRAALRMVDAVGAEARGFLDAAAVPDDDGEVLVIQVDGRGAPMTTAAEAERRRQPRRKRSGTKRH